MRAIHKFGKQVLLKWLQCTARFIKRLECKDLNQYDIFVSIIKGSDNIADHAIDIYNDWIFDGNKKVVIPLFQGGLNYCGPYGYLCCLLLFDVVIIMVVVVIIIVGVVVVVVIVVVVIFVIC